MHILGDTNAVHKTISRKMCCVENAQKVTLPSNCPQNVYTNVLQFALNLPVICPQGNFKKKMYRHKALSKVARNAIMRATLHLFCPQNLKIVVLIFIHFDSDLSSR